MTPELEQRIRDMAGAKATENQIKMILHGWDELFASMHMPPEQQEKEFIDTMRLRVQSGVVSIVADRPFGAPSASSTYRAKR